MDNYEYCINTMKIEKNYRKDFDNRIKQLCEDYCDQAEESKIQFFLLWLNDFLRIEWGRKKKDNFRKESIGCWVW